MTTIHEEEQDPYQFQASLITKVMLKKGVDKRISYMHRYLDHDLLTDS